MKKIWILLSISLLVLIPFGGIFAQNSAPSAPQEYASHADVAALMVKVLGISHLLPPVPTAQQTFTLLGMNGIAPAEGWQLDATLSIADLARILVQAMNLQDEVENPDDPQSWIDVLRAHGIEITSVRENFDNLEILPNRVGANILTQTSDPLLIYTSSNPMDEPFFGVDMAIVRRVLSEMEMTYGEFRPISPTPH